MTTKGIIIELGGNPTALSVLSQDVDSQII